LLLTLAKKEAFDTFLLGDQSLIKSAESDNSTLLLNASIVVLFADAVKGSLLSTNLEVQAGTLDLIFHFLSSDANIHVLLETLIDENVADYVFEALRLSGRRNALFSFHQRLHYFFFFSS
jgi:hypothetical protein